mgnify:CR=1 FL=1
MNPPIDLLLRNVRIVTCTDDVCAITPPAFVAIFGGLIAGLGPMTQLDPDAAVVKEFDGEGALLTPGFIDCHTHLVHAGHRAREFEMRLHGASYEEIARAGGGIVSTVRQTREAVPSDLMAQSARRLAETQRPRARSLLARSISALVTGAGSAVDGAGSGGRVSVRSQADAASEAARTRRAGHATRI